MNYKKYLLFSSFLLAIFVLAGCGNSGGNESSAVDKNSQIVFFYGSECPHCKIVEDYLNENKVSEKINFAQAEVWHNKDNASFMLEKAAGCGIKQEDLGVPFLWANSQCIIGQDQVIQFFKDKVNNNSQ